jgi:translation initiation factor IF-3
MDKVKISVRLKGREREQPQRAWELLDRVILAVPESRSSKIDGPIAIAILEPKSQKSK